MLLAGCNGRIADCPPLGVKMREADMDISWALSTGYLLGTDFSNATTSISIRSIRATIAGHSSCMNLARSRADNALRTPLRTIVPMPRFFSAMSPRTSSWNALATVSGLTW